MVIAALGAELQIHALSGDPAPSTQKIFYFSRQNNSHHRPASFLSSVRQDFGERGIQFTTSTNRNDLNIENLNQYDGTFFFGNHDAFSAAQTSALETYLQEGGGMVGMHVIAYVARSNTKLARILGGAFLGHHSPSEFTSTLIQSPSDFPTNLESHPHFPFEEGDTYTLAPSHPIVKGLSTYTSVDEPYLHQSLNSDIILLSYRDDRGGLWDEPYTWVRHEGEGRVFYHANGHDSRTWDKPNFRELMIRGTSWASKIPERSYTELFPPLISESGEIQYLAMVQTNDGPRLALHTKGKQTAMAGLQVPGSNESLTYLISPSTAHSMLDNQQVVLAPKAISGEDELSCLLIGHRQYPRVVAMENGPADSLEAGFTFSPNQTFPFVTDSHQAVAFSATIEDSAGGNQKRVFALQDWESLSPILIEGDPLASDESLTIHSIPNKPVFFSKDRRLAITAAVQSDQGDPQDVILTGDPEDLHPHVFSNQSYDGLPQDAVIENFLAPVSLAGDQVIFSGHLAGESVAPSNDQLIATISHDGSLDLLIREGDLIEGLSLSLNLDLLPPIPRNRDILVWGTLAGDLAIISSQSGRLPRLLARENQATMLDGQEYLITELHSDSLIGEGNQAVVVATLRASGSVDKISALLQIGSGTIRALALEGHQIDLAGGPFTISSLACHASTPHGSGMKNNALRFTASSQEGSNAIMGITNIDDLDQDGLSDTLESAFGNSIVALDSSMPPGLPKVIRDNSGQLQLTFWEPNAPGPGLEYQIETSDDMKVWRTISPEVVPSADQDNLPENYRRVIALIEEDGGTRFYRLSF